MSENSRITDARGESGKTRRTGRTLCRKTRPMDAAKRIPADTLRRLGLAALALVAALGLRAPQALAASVDAAEFLPGKEVQVNDVSIGGLGYYKVYLPDGYTPALAWPTVFTYHGLNGKPSTNPFRQVLGGKGLIIVGMEYYGRGLEGYDHIDRDVANAHAVLKALSKRLRIDPRRVFIGGHSKGGWMASAIADDSPALWAGLLVLGAGRHYRENALADRHAYEGKPVYIGAGSEENNLEAARRARDFYLRAGAKVTFEAWPGLGHRVDTKSKGFHDWLWQNGPMKTLDADLAAAKRAGAAGHLGQALAVCRHLATLADDHPAAGHAADAVKELTNRAEGLLADALKAVADKRYAEAGGLLARIAAAYQGTEFADRADERLKALRADPDVSAQIADTKLNAEATEAESKARAAEEQANWTEAIALYEAYVERFLDAERHENVKAHLESIKADPGIQNAIRNRQAESQCRGWLNMADNFAKAGRPDKAREYLQKVLDEHPDTEWADQARQRLADLPATTHQKG